MALGEVLCWVGLSQAWPTAGLQLPHAPSGPLAIVTTENTPACF